MRLVVQRVRESQVTVDGQCVGKIGAGLLIFLGIADGDTHQDADYLLNKAVNLRIFEDDQGKMNRSLLDCGFDMLVVSQFTLYGDCRKGRRPSFTGAMHPDRAVNLYDYFVTQAQNQGITVAQGVFGAHMDIALVNDGPVTFIIESL